ncbi:hypothetical protein LguiA_021120 [Lonicera macranthoides]
MEIDLNHGVSELVKGAFCNGECRESDGCVFCCLGTSNSSQSPDFSSINMELWYACAGPLITLPKKGNVVVYFPQGHLEQFASNSPYSPMEMPTFGLKPQLFCRVLDVQLLAEKENDEVYTQVTLLPQPTPELSGTSLESKKAEGMVVDEDTKTTPQMFCKTLTASDTSTHGGFSVPRRAAEDCFPPLDYTQQRPSQELVAKDLHGVEWRFRHIYRGQPRRHLLTTGWSHFVGQKNLVSGDAVLFLRGKDGDLRLGIRRAARPRNGLPDSIFGNQNYNPNVLSQVANAISTKRAFHVFCSPRASHADFVVPYQKYVKSINNQILIGTRFKMKFDMEECPERRFSGVVTGVGDLDPYRWPNSKWRSLMVKWDGNITRYRQERVSPWEINPSISLPPLSTQSSPRLKKLRTDLHTTPPEDPVVDAGDRFLDLEESVRSSKVLQGQENLCSVSPLYGCDKMNHRPNFETHQSPKSNEFTRTHSSTTCLALESNRFPKVLQGQGICSLSALSRKINVGFDFHKMYQRPRDNFYPLASQGARNVHFPYSDVYKTRQGLAMLSYKSPIQSGDVINEVGKQNIPHEQRPIEKISLHPNLEAYSSNDKDEKFDGAVSSCKLFGFSLIGEISNSNAQKSKRSCTKGNLVGRAMDLSRMNSYDELLLELERLFNMEGLLTNPEKGWRVLFMDDKNEMMVAGDDPWHEFYKVVSKIHIHTQEEVQKMTMGMVISNNTQSCLEEAAAIIDSSKSSLVGPPDSSSTVHLPRFIRI